MNLLKSFCPASKQRMVSLISLSVIVMLGGCSQPSDTAVTNGDSQALTSASEASPPENIDPSPTPTPPSTSSNTPPATIETISVTASGFGNAELCMTRDQLQQALPELVVSPYQDEVALVDAEGVTITDSDDNVEFYALTGRGSGPKLDFFMTDNPKYQTAEGIGPGMLIDTAVSKYGAAQLSYNTDNESREFVSFQNGPENIWFRTGSGAEAGIYAPGGSGYYKTEQYNPTAKIRSISVANRGPC